MKPTGMVYLATRAHATDLFSAPQEEPELRAAVGAVFDVSLTADQRYVVFAHSLTTVQLYEASR